MSFFSHNLIHSITYDRPAATANSNGDPSSIGAQVTATAKVIAKTQHVFDADGNERVSSHEITTEADVKIGDRVWIVNPALDNVAVAGDARHPISVQRSVSLSGNATLVRVFL